MNIIPLNVQISGPESNIGILIFFEFNNPNFDNIVQNMDINFGGYHRETFLQ